MKYEKDRVIGYVPQVLDFERTLPITVEDFMAMTNQKRPCFLGISKKHKETVDNLLKKLGVYEKKKRLLGNLSGGERQRLAIARALYNNPAIILADEPTASLDSDRAFEVVDLLSKECKEKNKSIIMVTHDNRMIEKCDHVYRMKDGILTKER